MKVYCTDTFRREYLKIIKNKGHRGLGNMIINQVLTQPFSSLATSIVLNGRRDIPFYKKDIGGRSGYRLYCMLVIKDDKLYLLFVHPKKGKYASDNIKSGYYRELEQELIDALTTQNLFVVSNDRDNLIFTPQQEAEAEEE